MRWRHALARGRHVTGIGTRIALPTGMTTRAYPVRIEDDAPQSPREKSLDIAEPPIPDERPRRILNIVVALVGIIITVPVMFVIALLVKMSSPGPVRFVQTRVGRDRRRRRTGDNTGTRHRDLGGEPFRIYKFRTMHHSSDGTQRWASAADPRITPIGRVLRQFRFDELPQLFNVLRGDMNVVGPRPEQPDIFERLRGRITRYTRRQRVRPGITGWAQINLAYDQTEEDARRKLQYDLDYIGRQSLTEDLRIMAKTLPVMFGRRGAH